MPPRRTRGITLTDPRVRRLLVLGAGVLHAPRGAGRKTLALLMGLSCHTLFAAAVLGMMGSMFFGLSRSPGRAPFPLAAVIDLGLILQFAVGHSLLLTRRGGRILSALVPGSAGRTLTTTTYALVASVQLLSVFLFWTPSGVVWWRAEGPAFWLACLADAAAWALLAKSIFDAGLEVQSGALGWMSLMAARPPVFPGMPRKGLFRVVRQPIYASFALTLWTVPVWTPDQLALALGFSLYCLAAPLLKERRFEQRYGRRFERYQRRTPYFVPRLPRLRRTSRAA